MTSPLYSKVLVFGEPEVGKSWLCQSMKTKKPVNPSECEPQSSFDPFSCEYKKGDFLINLNIWCTSGLENDESKLQTYCSQTDIGLLCFSMVDYKSLEQAVKKWYPVFQKHCPHAELFLVGCKKDNSDKANEIQSEEIKNATKKIVAKLCYTSAINYSGIEEILNEAFSKLFPLNSLSIAKL